MHLTPAQQRALRLRADVLDAIRRFLSDRGFLEVDTPVRVATPALELHIDAEASGDAWLRTSPELHMKRLLAGGLERIFQIGPCFRRGEQGALHHPEYTMLEWYRTGTDYRGILDDTRDLLRHLARTPGLRERGTAALLDRPWHIRTVSEEFLEQAGWDPLADYDPDRFDLDLVEKVEPSLPADRPSVLIDYPAACAALARIRPGRPPAAERWELYLGGVELANAYTELTEADEQRERFLAWARARARDKRAVYPLDEAFLEALRMGLPPCGGIALGIDRLVMVLAGERSLDNVLPFRAMDNQR